MLYQGKADDDDERLRLKRLVLTRPMTVYEIRLHNNREALMAHGVFASMIEPADHRKSVRDEWGNRG